MLSFSFKIIYIEQDTEGEICSGCVEEIEGKSYTMMLDFDDPVNFPPYPLDVIYCLVCKNKFDASDSNSG